MKVSAHLFLSKTWEQALQLAQEHAVPIRASCVDGDFCILTQDFRPDRINVNLANNVVIAANHG